MDCPRNFLTLVMTFFYVQPGAQNVNLSSKIAQQLPDGLAQNIVQTFVVPEG